MDSVAVVMAILLGAYCAHFSQRFTKVVLDIKPSHAHEIANIRFAQTSF